MAMTFVVAMIGAASAGLALFGGMLPDGSVLEDMLSLIMAGMTALAVASASALDL